MKTGLIRAVKVILAMIAGFIVSALVPIAVGTYWPVIVAGFGFATFYFTGDKTKQVVEAPTGGMALGPMHAPSVTSESIQHGKRRLWGSAAVFAAVIAGFLVWAYLQSQSQKAEDLRQSVAIKTQEMLGPNFDVESVSLPSGVGSYETVALVTFSIVADGQRDSLTMIITGNCDDVCRIRMDPRDALRLAQHR